MNKTRSNIPDYDSHMLLPYVKSEDDLITTESSRCVTQHVPMGCQLQQNSQILEWAASCHNHTTQHTTPTDQTQRPYIQLLNQTFPLPSNYPSSVPKPAWSTAGRRPTLYHPSPSVTVHNRKDNRDKLPVSKKDCTIHCNSYVLAWNPHVSHTSIPPPDLQNLIIWWNHIAVRHRVPPGHIPSSSVPYRSPSHRRDTYPTSKTRYHRSAMHQNEGHTSMSRRVGNKVPGRQRTQCNSRWVNRACGTRSFYCLLFDLIELCTASRP